MSSRCPPCRADPSRRRECRAADRGTCRRRFPRPPSSPARARASLVTVMTHRSCRSKLFDTCEIDVRQALRGELLLFDPARQLRDRCEGDVGIVRGHCRRRAPCCARRRRASAPTRREAPDSSASPARIVGLERDLPRSGRGAREAAPSIGRQVVCGHRSARRASSSPARAFRLPQMWTVTPRARRLLLWRTSAALLASSEASKKAGAERRSLHATAAATTPSGAVIRNCRRVFMAKDTAISDAAGIGSGTSATTGAALRAASRRGRPWKTVAAARAPAQREQFVRLRGAGHRLLGEPLDGAGNRRSGLRAQHRPTP